MSYISLEVNRSAADNMPLYRRDYISVAVFPGSILERQRKVRTHHKWTPRMRQPASFKNGARYFFGA
jgi:hypothetical protein